MSEKRTKVVCELKYRSLLTIRTSLHEALYTLYLCVSHDILLNNFFCLIRDAFYLILLAIVLLLVTLVELRRTD